MIAEEHDDEELRHHPDQIIVEEEDGDEKIPDTFEFLKNPSFKEVSEFFEEGD